MKILYYSWEEIISNDIYETMHDYGCTVTRLRYNLSNNISDAGFISYVESMLDEGIDGETYDYIFSCNFLPVISKIALRKKIKYISWCFDSPCTTLYSEMIYNPYNYIFHFDKYEVARLKKNGVSNVFHLPLAVNMKRINTLLDNNPISDNDIENVTFMGNMYASAPDYEYLYSHLDDYLKGCMDAIVDVQKVFQGGGMLDELLDDVVVNRINASVAFQYTDEFKISNKDIIENILYRKISGDDRKRIIKRIADKYKITLYTNTEKSAVVNNSNIDYRGTLDYYNNMSVVFRNSKINLNITIRSIRTGIPLRAMDIMASGGFLLSNYQEELAEYFIDGEDMVLYYDDEDMMNKIEYYLAHDEERKRIAENGCRKVSDKYSYANAWRYIFSVCNLKNEHIDMSNR